MPSRQPASRAATAKAAVPAFALYGEPGGPGAAGADMLHVESIASRSQRYRWEIDAHLHQGLHQVLWLESGSAQVRLDEGQHACTGPVVIAIPPGVVHAFRFAPHSAGCVLTLSAAALVQGDAQAAGQALGMLFAAPRVLPLADDKEQPRLAQLFALLNEEFSRPRPAGSPVPLWLARALVWRLAQLAAQHDQAGGSAARGQQALYTRFLVLLEAHLAEHWPVSRYAQRLGLSTERLNRLVRAETGGHSALAVIHDRLVREACRRLVYVAAPISRLAFDLGFDDPAYFTRFFKRHTGQSPSDWRAASIAASG